MSSDRRVVAGLGRVTTPGYGVRKDEMDNCDNCEGSGIHFIGAMFSELTGHAIERCDTCKRYASDAEAAAATGCEFDPEAAKDERFIITSCPPGAPILHYNQVRLAKRLR